MNARLRRVVADKDELVAAQEAMLNAQREQLSNQDELIRLQREQIGSQGEMIAAQTELIKQLQDEVAELRRRLDRDSTNSSTPPSKDSIAAKAKQRVDRSSRERSKDRKPGGQPGREGTGLRPAAEPDRTELVESPSECRECRADLAGSTELADG